MKIALNKAYGGFCLSDAFVQAYPQFKELNRWRNPSLGERTDPEFIKALEEFDEGYLSDIEVVEIPDEATDWEIDAYDGWEAVTYVLDGKLGHI